MSDNFFSRPGSRRLCKVPKGEQVVAMTTMLGTTVFVATTAGVYRLAERRKGTYKLVPIPFVEPKK